MMQRLVEVPHLPKRIVSLVPSQTELLYDLGLEECVVGVTNFCTRPKEWRKSKTLVGGTKKLNMEVVAALKPDLILGNKEENDKHQIEALAKVFPVWMSDIYTLEDALDMLNKVGPLTNTQKEATTISNSIKSSFKALQKTLNLSVLYLIWQNPFMAAGKQTFIHSMLKEAGFSNAITNTDRYPELSSQEINQINPDLIFLSSEPFPFREKNRKQLQELFPKSKVLLADGEAFSWYGSRLLHTPSYIKEFTLQLSS